MVKVDLTHSLAWSRRELSSKRQTKHWKWTMGAEMASFPRHPEGNQEVLRVTTEMVAQTTRTGWEINVGDGHLARSSLLCANLSEQEQLVGKTAMNHELTSENMEKRG